MYTSVDPGALLVVGGVCTIAGLMLIWKAISGDTLLAGTAWTRIPRWMLWGMGLILQAPLPLAFWFLRKQGLALWA